MATERIDVAAGDRTVSISNPDKVYFPDLGEGGRKIDLVTYYATVGEIALTSVAGRPTYLQRYPDGIEGEEVYQKRLPPKSPEWLGRVTVTFPGGRKAEVLRPQQPADLVWAAQYGTITLHPWPAMAADLAHPDLMRIDLDPQPGTDFSDAVWASLELLRPILDELGIVGFPKTSGGRGIHVDVPLTAGWTFAQVRRSVLAIAREMERRAPERVTSAWWKEERGERLFIDFNQMLPDKTIAAAYTVRARPGAPVSTPVTWDELPSVSTMDFTIHTVPHRLHQVGDLQASMREASAGLERALAWVERDEANGQGETNYPPNFPKMPGEPPRVQPSKKVAEHWEGTQA
ncbi:MAG TPA: DNA primase small subunit domain-containing protein [Actinomycetes bacterium]|nr:DNA primase small subunit domain-containing protein [Actinomycetes bacterium]